MDALDPRIGELNGGQFYCYPHGYDQSEFRGTRQECEVALGLIKPPVPVQGASNLKLYRVTVTPSMTVYSGAWRGDAYAIEVLAESRDKAIAIVREQRRLQDGRHGVPVTYRAKRIQDS